MHSTDTIIDILTPIVGSGVLSGVTVRDGALGFILTLPPDRKGEFAALEQRCRDVLASYGFSRIQIIHTVHDANPIAPRENGPYTEPRARAQWNLTPVEGVKKIIAVASGKGGVGKSNTTLGLAHAAVAKGLRVGVLDADIYGPSIPLMLGLKDKGQPEIADGKMVPYTAHGIKAMSVGFVMGGNAAILRGPMISKTLQQLLRSTLWGELDVLFVDMPPGTGDVTISLCQQAPLDGVVIVTTPQELATIDAKKCAMTFEKLGVSLLGVIETMSWFELPDGSRHALFGEGGGAALASAHNVPLLAQVPMVPSLREAADRGLPIRHTAYTVALEAI